MEVQKFTMEKWKFTSSLNINSTVISFVYILMHGREEWVLVYLGSQHKRVERPVQPLLPDYFSVSCDYGRSNCI